MNYCLRGSDNLKPLPELMFRFRGVLLLQMIFNNNQHPYRNLVEIYKNQTPDPTKMAPSAWPHF